MTTEARKRRNYKEDFKRDAVVQGIPSPFKSGRFYSLPIPTTGDDLEDI